MNRMISYTNLISFLVLILLASTLLLHIRPIPILYM